jgi:hypothetical protein
MGWRYFLKRLLVVLAVFTIGALLIIPLILPGRWTLWNIILSLFCEGALLLIFGALLGTSFSQGASYRRFAGNPPVTRDTRRHAASRWREQSQSRAAFLVAGGIVLTTALILLTIYPLLQIP